MVSLPSSFHYSFSDYCNLWTNNSVLTYFLILLPEYTPRFYFGTADLAKSTANFKPQLLNVQVYKYTFFTLGQQKR